MIHKQLLLLFINNYETDLHRRIGQLTDALELLDADKVVHAIDGHGLDDLVPVELPDGLGALLAPLLGLLDSHQLVAFQADTGSHLPTIGRRLLELLSNLKLELHGLEGGAGLDGPHVALLGYLHDGSGDGGRLPQQHVDVQSLQEVVVLLSRDALVLAHKGVHGEADEVKSGRRLADEL